MKPKPIIHHYHHSLQWLPGSFDFNHSSMTRCGLFLRNVVVRNSWRWITCKNCLRTKKT